MTEPTLEAIRARHADKRTLWMLHGERDVGWLLEMLDERDVRIAELEAREAERAAFAARQHAALDALNGGRDVLDALLAPDGPAPPLSDEVVAELLGEGGSDAR